MYPHRAAEIIRARAYGPHQHRSAGTHCSASISGGYPNSRLDIDISYPGLQHRTTYALTNYFNGLANKVQQQELKKNEQTAVPKL